MEPTNELISSIVKTIEFAHSMTPKNLKARMPAGTPQSMTRKELQKTKSSMLETGLKLALQAGIESVKKDDEVQHLIEVILDPNTPTTKAIMMLQSFRAKSDPR